jgi:hypothetical protein
MTRARPLPVPALVTVAILLFVGPASSATGHLAAASRLLPAAQSELPCPPFPGPAAFVARIDNPYLPMLPGTTYIYRGTEDGDEERNVVEVTHETKSILGVQAVVVRDTVSDRRGGLIEQTLDWFAQDTAGHVWYLGEDSKDYEHGQVVSTEGSWEAGVGGAQPGILMMAQPGKGVAYRQECAPGVAEDSAQILDLKTSVETSRDDYGHALRIREWTPLEPGVAEEKYYVKCIGLVKVVVVKGGKGSTSLVDVQNGPSATELGCKDKRNHHRKHGKH